MNRLYSIFDKKTAVYEPPCQMHNDEAATRWFGQCVTQVPMMRAHPSDFELYYVASFDEKEGKVTPMTKQFICNGLDSYRLTQQAEIEHEQTLQEAKVSDDPSIQSST